MSTISFTEIKDEFGWHWYKKSIDAECKVEFQHGSNPTEYPVKVKSECSEDSYGRDYISHIFVYRQRVECDSCHSTKIVWPEGHE